MAERSTKIRDNSTGVKQWCEDSAKSIGFSSRKETPKNAITIIAKLAENSLWTMPYAKISCLLSPTRHLSTDLLVEVIRRLPLLHTSRASTTPRVHAYHKSHRHQRQAQILRPVWKSKFPSRRSMVKKTTVIPENIQKIPLQEQHPSSKKINHNVDLAKTKLTNTKSKVMHFQRTGIVLPIPVARIGRTWKGRGRRPMSVLDLPARSDSPESTPDLATLRICGAHESDAQRTRMVTFWDIDKLEVGVRTTRSRFMRPLFSYPPLRDRILHVRFLASLGTVFVLHF